VVLGVYLSQRSVSQTASPSTDRFKTEPEVRIGILQKATHAKFRLPGSYRAFAGTGRDAKELRYGKNEILQVELYNIGVKDIPGKYRVILGAFRSFEQAEYTLEKLGKLPFDSIIAQPKQWNLWFGPFNSMDEAQYAMNYIVAKGFRNTRIEQITSGVTVLTIYTSDGSLIHIGGEPVVIYPLNGNFILNHREYRGSAEIAPDVYGTFNVINRVPADVYLASVLPREMPASANIEALKAQAVIARTYLLNNMRRHAVDNFNLCATSDCQVYGGAGDETSATTDAVRKTRGQVLLHNGRLANALFHSTCGGRTADYSDNWSGDGPDYLVSVDDGSGFAGNLASADTVRQFLDRKTGNCEASKYFRWEKVYAAAELLAVLQQTIPEFNNNPDLKIGALNGVSVLEYTPSGRVGKINIDTDAGRFTFEKDIIRWVLGNLKSTFFVLETRETNGKTEYVFRGAGWGHAVGLCQIGAMKMAKDGNSYTQILNHYYPKTTLETLWK